MDEMRREVILLISLQLAIVAVSSAISGQDITGHEYSRHRLTN